MWWWQATSRRVHAFFCDKANPWHTAQTPAPSCRLPLADCITLLFCNPAICAILGWLLLGEQFGWMTTVGCVCAYLCVSLVRAHPGCPTHRNPGCRPWAQYEHAPTLPHACRCLASLAGVVLIAQPPFILHLFSAAVEQQPWTHTRAVGMALGVTGALLAACAYVTIRVIGK